MNLREFDRFYIFPDPNVMIPLTWPDGKYGLTKPTDGCPNKEFTWNEGHRYQDTEDRQGGDNDWSDHIHMTELDASHITLKFCIKTVSNVNGKSKWTWQPGSYCIFKYGDDCPPGSSHLIFYNFKIN